MHLPLLVCLLDDVHLMESEILAPSIVSTGSSAQLIEHVASKL